MFTLQLNIIKNILKLFKNGQTGSYIDLPNLHICYKSSPSLLLMEKANLLQKFKYISSVKKEKKNNDRFRKKR